ncbi:hypothetical protein WAE56_12670 [Iodobacter sp. LRB]|uniref:hypothetical protein n=1 Tax=unclassified Iodobacter TaxID=235634 RepID=UPI000C0F54FC|nr:hypothetical protein [Iodobacter sp. BJB302]PHV00915.1 hypothetical protein CSQ88_14940 [Iodobacter sp. BJB302]
MPQFWFRSNMFHVDPKEDDETNPFCYGKELAQWLKQKFEQLGYSAEQIIPEDFGWCIVLSRDSGLLWVGCTNIRSDLYEKITEEQKSTYIPDGSALTWSVFVGIDKPPIWSTFFANRRAVVQNLEQAAQKIGTDLEAILTSEKQINLVPQP